VSTEFRLLGNVEIWINGQRADVGHARQRSVLVALLVDAGRVVGVDQLVDRVWGGDPVPTCRDVLYSYVSRLRRRLAGGGVGIERRQGGYVIGADTETVDLHRFRLGLARARAESDDRVALRAYESALGEWRGEPFGTLDSGWLADVRTGLAAERLTAELDRNEVALRLGEHVGLEVKLAELAAVYPLDERLAGQLALSLYLGGRSADALAMIQHTRRRLADELGVDPGVRLRDVELTILRREPVGSRGGSTAGSRPSVHSVLARQLVAPPRLFTGRKPQLAVLTRNLYARGDASPTVVISAIGGAGGIGKTALALYWAHQNIERFPDGQLHVNLRGFDPSGEPMRSEVAVRGFLDALGVEPAAIPVDADAQAALYRSLMVGKRMLVVLDNARSSEQVEPLLPGSPTCTVLVTSRSRLSGLVTRHGAHPLGLDVFPQAEARELFTRHAGVDRMAAEPEAVTELLGWCAGLPLAVSIVAARAAQHPDFPLAGLAEELRERSARLDALEGGELTASLRAVFSWSYHALDGERAKVFGLLGLAPGPDISLPAAANLTGLPIPRMRVVLDGLEDASLVQQPVPGRWRMYDLIRLYATDQAHRDQPEDTREAALRGVTDFYLHTAHTADRLLSSHREPIDPDPPGAGCRPHPLSDPAAALAWFEAEHPCLLATQHLAAIRGWHPVVWQLAWTLTTFHARRGHLHDRVAAWQAGLTAARQIGDPALLLRAHRDLGWACAFMGRHADALDHLHQALTLAQGTGDLLAQALTHRALARAWEQRGEDQQALEHATSALHLFQAFDRPVLEADLLNIVGWLSARLGRYEQARTHCETALTLARRHHYRQGEAATLDSLGYLAHRTGQYAQALDHYHHALTFFRDFGDSYEKANTLDRLGQTHAALGDHDQGRHAWRQALALYRAQHRTSDADRIQQQLDDLRERQHEHTGRTRQGQ
jgi:DNA-binding SARP family transcriptional activator/tetratricopeptide (TPR) repeat protein